MSKLTLIRPRVSEKAYATSQNGVYVFIVPSSANKHEVAAAVKAQYDVEVVSVNIVVQKGKAVRFYRAGKFENGTRSDFKKAYVRLAEGLSLPIFAAEDQAAEPEAKEEAKAKKAAKKGDK